MPAASGWQSPVCWSRGHPQLRHAGGFTVIISPFYSLFLIFWSSPSRCGVLGGMAVGGMQLLCREEMLPEHRGETEAEKCGVSDL